MSPFTLLIGPKGKGGVRECPPKPPKFEGGHFSDGFKAFVCICIQAHLITGLPFEEWIVSWLKVKYV